MTIDTLYRAIAELLGDRLEPGLAEAVTIRLDADIRQLAIRHEDWTLSLDQDQAVTVMVRLLRTPRPIGETKMKKLLALGMGQRSPIQTVI